MPLFYTAWACCVTITCFTNTTVIRIARAVLHHDSRWPKGPQIPASLTATKDTVFFLCLIVFGSLLWRAMAPRWPHLWRQLRERSLWGDLLPGLAIASLFVVKVFIQGMGVFYAMHAVAPFVQEPGFYYRRILMMVLAHDLHLAGPFYAILYWAIVLATFALALLYLRDKGLRLSRLELGSLFTTGIFASAIGLPGYNEVLVAGFALFAVFDFNRAGRAGLMQIVCFGLAMLTHESAAVVMFAPLALWFGFRFALHFAVLLAVYLCIWLASFGFDVHAAVAVQVVQSGQSVAVNTLSVQLSILTVWKVGLLAWAVAVARMLRAGDYRGAAVIAAMATLGVATTCLAIDYTRMVAFGSLALVFALPAALRGVSDRQRRWFAVANLAVPSVYIGAYSGVAAYRGAYGLVLHALGVAMMP